MGNKGNWRQGSRVKLVIVSIPLLAALVVFFTATYSLTTRSLAKGPFELREPPPGKLVKDTSPTNLLDDDREIKQKCVQLLAQYKHKPLIRKSSESTEGQKCKGAPRPWHPLSDEPPDTSSEAEQSTAGKRRLLRELPDTRGASETLLQASGGGGRNGSDYDAAFEWRRHLLGVADKSTHLRRSYCKDKGPRSGGQGAGPSRLRRWEALGEAQQVLACCVMRGNKGCPPAATPAIQEALKRSKALKALETPPKCLRVTVGGSCSATKGNPETEMQGSYSSKLRPKQDWKRAEIPSCALVGRSPAIKIAANGPAIDAHASVWRFNLASTQGVQRYVGKKTNMRIVNNADAHRAKMGLGGTSERLGNLAIEKDEQWVFWQYGSVRFMEGVSQKQKVPVSLMAPGLIKWMMDRYFAIKDELEDMGLGPFNCPTSVSSGMHAVLMASQMCKQVDLFGYSYYNKMLTAKEGHNNGPQAMYKGHSWRLDMSILRLLAFSGRISICTADDPLIDMGTLQKRTDTNFHGLDDLAIAATGLPSEEEVS